MYLLRFGTGVVRQAGRIMLRRRKESRWAARELATMEFNAGTVLPEHARRKILTSFGIYLPMVVDAFSAVQGRKTSPGERYRMLQYFICSTTFDNFTDDAELTEAELHQISYASESFTPATAQERMFLEAHLALKQFVAHKEEYESVTRALFQAQVNSSRQTDPALTNEEIYDITISKGAYAVMLCNFYMEDHGLLQALQRCWYLLGGIIQFTNDLFDTWKDLQEGIQTLPTRMTCTDQLYQQFINLVDELEQEISTLPVSDIRKNDFRFNMMAICSFGNMAISQLSTLRENGVMPRLHTLSRKALIIDMEQPANIWECIRFTYRRCKAAI